MRRRTVLAGAATALAAGLAGCGSRGGDGSDGATTPDPEADWTDGDALAIDALERAHVEAVTGAGSFTVRSTAETSHAGEERPDEWLLPQTLESRFDAETERQAITQTLTEADETTEAYVTTDEAYIRQAVDGEVQYQRQGLDRSSEDFRTAMEGEARTGVPGLADWNLAYAETTTREGETAYRYEADAYEGDRGVPAEIESASATVLVSPAGLVYSIEQSFAGTHEGQEAEVDVTIEYLALGETSVEEPEWLDEAKESTDG